MVKDLKKQLRNLNLSKLKLKNGSNVETEIKRHASILADCIMEELDKVYSYQPKVYLRTYDLYSSLYVDDKLEIRFSGKGANLSIGIHFDDGAMHESFNGNFANTAILINEGWKTNGNFADIPYLGYREGTHFIENGIKEYKRKVSNPFPVRFKINNEERLF